MVMVNSAPWASVQPPFSESAEADFGALKVEQNSAWMPSSRAGADGGDARSVVVGVAVRRVEAENVGAGEQELL